MGRATDFDRLKQPYRHARKTDHVWPKYTTIGQRITIFNDGSTESRALEEFSGFGRTVSARDELHTAKYFVDRLSQGFVMEVNTTSFRATRSSNVQASGSVSNSIDSHRVFSREEFWGMTVKDILKSKPSSLPKGVTSDALDDFAGNRVAEFFVSYLRNFDISVDEAAKLADRLVGYAKTTPRSPKDLRDIICAHLYFRVSNVPVKERDLRLRVLARFGGKRAIPGLLDLMDLERVQDGRLEDELLRKLIETHGLLAAPPAGATGADWQRWANEVEEGA